MAEVKIDPGICIAFGGSIARVAVCSEGDISGFKPVPTPDSPKAFFGWIARGVLDASHEGMDWLVAGFPGPVNTETSVVGPMENVNGLKKSRVNLLKRLVAEDPEVGRVLDQGFTLLAVNDGTLAAHAAATKIGENQYEKTGAVIVGTGIGSGVVLRDQKNMTIHRVDETSPLEIGHLLLSADPFDTIESRYSGPGMKKRYGVEPKNLPARHPAWIEQGAIVGRLALTLGLMNEVTLVVPTGGVGAGASNKLKSHIDRFASNVRKYGNGAQKLLMPEIKYVPSREANEFEMYGGEGVMRDYYTTPTSIKPDLR